MIYSSDSSFEVALFTKAFLNSYRNESNHLHHMKPSWVVQLNNEPVSCAEFMQSMSKASSIPIFFHIVIRSSNIVAHSKRNQIERKFKVGDEKTTAVATLANREVTKT